MRRTATFVTLTALCGIGLSARAEDGNRGLDPDFGFVAVPNSTAVPN